MGKDRWLTNYVIRVGITTAICAVVILITKILFPGKEGLAVYLMTAVVFAVLFVRGLAKGKKLGNKE